MKVPVSVMIPVKNDADNLRRCLSSLTWADEIYVVDSYSADDTDKVAAHAGAKIVQFDLKGHWPKKKTWALANLEFKHDWIFIIDADEELPPSAEGEFRSICAGPKKEIRGYFIDRQFFFMGKPLRHCYRPNWTLRLFRKGCGQYERLLSEDAGSGDNEVHEQIVLDGKSGRLATVMNHYAFPTVDVFVEKHNRYAKWEAALACERKVSTGHFARLGSFACRARRYLKTASRHLPFRPFLRFVYVYFFQLGFLDGIEGYYFARLHGFYEFLCVCKTYEMKLGNGKRS